MVGRADGRPLVVASLGHGTIEQMIESGRRTAADLVEARVDLLPSPTEKDVEALVRGLGRASLVTVRSRAEGGSFAGSDEARAALLRAAVGAGAYAVDVELEAPFRDAIVAEAKARGVRCVVSFHDLAGTPAAGELVARLRAARDAGAWVAKGVVTLRAPDDASEVARASVAARQSGIAYCLMAVNDPVLRVLAPLLGQSLVYGRPDNAPATAPGQVGVRTLASSHLSVAPAARGPAAARRPIYLFGDPVAHSLSPLFQNAGLAAAGVNAVYLAARVPAASLATAVRALPAVNALGANVTLPHKVAVLDCVDLVSPEARAAGAANTLVVRGDRVEARNTDGSGAVAALHEARVSVAHGRALVLGAGGAARSIARALLLRGTSVVLANRSPERGLAVAGALDVELVPWSDDGLRSAAVDANLLVNATTVGMADDALPIPADVLRSDLAVLDAVYRRDGTPLVRAARKAGAVAVPGERMLLHQGAAAYEIWTGRKAPVDAMDAALRAALADQEDVA